VANSYPQPTHLIAHLSDTHLLAGGEELYGSISTRDNLIAALSQLERSGVRPDAIVFTGDLTDIGHADAYRQLREIVEPVAARLGAQIVWVMGNHDEPVPFAEELLGSLSTGASLDQVFDLNGLRIISLDTSVPGYHHGQLTGSQLGWLRNVLATPAPHGTMLALHHPPIFTPIEFMQLIELRNPADLAEVVRGTDVRGILGGHLHYSTHALFAGIPVSVVAATCYTMNLAAGAGVLSGVNGAQGFNLVHVYADQVVHSSVPLNTFTEVAQFPQAFVTAMDALSLEDQREAFSNKNSRFDGTHIHLGEKPIHTEPAADAH
jgi:Icc protein